MNNFGGDRVDLLVEGLVRRSGRAVLLDEAGDALPMVRLLFAAFLKKIKAKTLLPLSRCKG